ncbi:actin-binding ADF family protein [Streptomyces sp. NPDC055134]
MLSAPDSSHLCSRLRRLTYVIYNLSEDKTQIVVEKTSASTKYEEFISDLPETEYRWAVYDFDFDVEGAMRNKLIFFSWSPDDARTKMLFASSKDALRKTLDGISVEVQGPTPPRSPTNPSSPR